MVGTVDSTTGIRRYGVYLLVDEAYLQSFGPRTALFKVAAYYEILLASDSVSRA